MTTSKHSLTWGLCLLAVLVGFFAVLLWSGRQENQTIDEGVHLAAGYSALTTRDFRLNPEHPALFKMLSALPLLALRPSLPLDHPSWIESEQWGFAHAFLYRNSSPADTLLQWGRLVPMLLAVALGFMVAWWGRRLWGNAASLAITLLLLADPNIVAHSRYITNDIAISLGFVLVAFCFCRWFEERTPRRLIFLSMSIVFALGMKFSALFVLLPLIIVSGTLLELRSRWVGITFEPPKKNTRFRYYAVAVGIVFVGVWASALFQFQPLSEVFRDQPGRVSETWQNVRVPAGSFFRGAGSVWGHQRTGHSSYFLGESSETGGWWNYFLVTFLLKTPTSTLLLLLLLLLALGKRWIQHARRRTRFRDLLNAPRNDLIVLSVLSIGYAGMTFFAGINLGLRHLLPLYPLLYLLIGRLFALQWSRPLVQRWWNPVLFAIVGVHLLVNAAIAPHYLAYFNSIAGGPIKGPNFLLDSNIDWGQDLKKFKRFLIERDLPTTLALNYFGKGDVKYYGINERPVPTDQDLLNGALRPDRVAISVHLLYLFRDQYQWLFQSEPAARIGYTIYYYDFSTSR